MERRKAEREKESAWSVQSTAPALVSSHIYIPLSHQLERFLWAGVCVCVGMEERSGGERERQGAHLAALLGYLWSILPSLLPLRRRGCLGIFNKALIPPSELIARLILL